MGKIDKILANCMVWSNTPLGEKYRAIDKAKLQIKQAVMVAIKNSEDCEMCEHNLQKLFEE